MDGAFSQLTILGASAMLLCGFVVLGRCTTHEHVARAVEAVTADAVLACESAVDGVRVCGRREGLVERRVEDGDMRKIGERGPRRADALNRARVVQRGESAEVAHRGDDLRRDPRGTVEALAAVDDAAADRVDAVVAALRQHLLGGAGGRVALDVIDQPVRQDARGRGGQLDQSILQRRAAGVENEYAHRRLLGDGVRCRRGMSYTPGRCGAGPVSRLT